MSEAVKDLLKFVEIGARLDLKVMALTHITGLTGTYQGLKMIIEIPELLVSLITLLDDNNDTIAKDAALLLINVSANEKGANALITLEIDKNCPPLTTPPDHIIHTLLKFIFNINSKIADPCCMILSNLTRPPYLTEKVVDFIQTSGRTFDEIINIFTNINYNLHGAKLHYLGPVLSNLSQAHRVRMYILDRNKCVIQRLLPFTEYPDSIVRRGGLAGTLKNCCFEDDFHEWLLSDEVDILPRLLVPLAGNEEFDEEDNDKLPFELQYLCDDKKREADPDIRCILIEAITKLCAKRKNREFIREKNTYVILRELHKNETDRKVLLACENLVDILIRTEDEIGEDNLSEIEIPQHLRDGFVEDDETFLNVVVPEQK